MTGAPQGTRVHNDRMLRTARAVAARHEPTAKELLLARHMADDGKTLQEIHDALGWPCTLVTASRRLRRFGIRPFAPRQSGGKSQAHRGRQTSHPDARPGRHMDMRSFRLTEAS